MLSVWQIKGQRWNTLGNRPTKLLLGRQGNAKNSVKTHGISIAQLYCE